MLRSGIWNRIYILSLFGLMSSVNAATLPECSSQIQARYSHIPALSVGVDHTVTTELQSNFWGIYGLVVKIDDHAYLSFKQPDWSNGEMPITFDGANGEPRDFGSGLSWAATKWNETLIAAKVQGLPVKVDPTALAAQLNRGSCTIDGSSLVQVVSIESGTQPPVTPNPPVTPDPGAPPAPSVEEGDRGAVLPPGTPLPGKVLPIDGDRS